MPLPRGPPRLGPGVGGPVRDAEKAFIFAAISAFNCVAPVRANGTAPGGLRAASVGPRGEEDVLTVGRPTGLESARGGVKRGVPSSRGLSRGEVADSSGEVGGEGESSGSDIVPCEGTGWERRCEQNSVELSPSARDRGAASSVEPEPEKLTVSSDW
jgi:hypothetical protein